MLNQIERDVYVLEEGIENPISYVRATNAIPIVFHFRDYEIPDSATAQVFVNKPSGLAVYNSATISGNSVIVDTTMQMFAELGVSELQVQISNGDDSLVTFSCPVKVAQNYIEYPSSQNESSLYNEIRDAISNAGTATTAANQAAQAANDAAEAVKEAVSGVINDSEESSLTTYSSEKIETEFIKKTGDASSSTVTFNVAIERANIQSGDTLAVAFGKLSKFCADLQPHAFAAPVNNLTGTDASLPLAAPQGKVLKAEIDELNSTLDWKVAGDVTGTDVITLNTWKELSVFIIGSDSNYYSLHFTRNMVISTGRRFRTGYYFSSNKYAGLELSIGSGGVRITELFENGISKTSSARLLVWYK